MPMEIKYGSSGRAASCRSAQTSARASTVTAVLAAGSPAGQQHVGGAAGHQYTLKYRAYLRNSSSVGDDKCECACHVPYEQPGGINCPRHSGWPRTSPT